MKKRTLYNMHMQIESWIAQESVLCIFHKQNIDKFYQTYGSRLDQINRDLDKLRRSHFEYDDDKTRLDERNQPVLIPGVTAQQAKAAYNALMDSEVVTMHKPLKLHKIN